MAVAVEMTAPVRFDVGRHALWLGDCRDVMAGMESNSVDAIVTDPPYFRVVDEPWDRQWDDPAAFLAWVGDLCVEFQRILRPNGSLYFFASVSMAARVEVVIRSWFNVLSPIVWRKGAVGGKLATRGNHVEKEALRNFFPASERVIFAEHYGADNIAKGEAGYVAKCDELRGFVFEPLRKYLADEWARAGLVAKDVTKATGTQMASHYMSRSQWALPTEENYAKLQDYANRHGVDRGAYLRREYEDLRREYEDLRRPFAVSASKQWSDVWDFEPVQSYPGKHPCEKPQALLRHILEVSTREDAIVFDPFAGGGSMAVACHETGRQFVGVEMCSKNHSGALARLKADVAQGRLF
jgi:site-specific DNA-methyltransferase (adenine-specific)